MGKQTPHPIQEQPHTERKQTRWLPAILSKDLIGQAFTGALFYLAVALSLAAAGWVLFASVVWPAENARQFRQTISLDEHRRLEIRGPQIIPVGEGDSSYTGICFTLYQDEPNGAPLILSLEAPEGLIAVSPEANYQDRVEIRFRGTMSQETQTLALGNARIIGGLRFAKVHLVVSWRGTGTEATLQTIPLQVEPILRAVLARYGGGGKEIPFFPLTTLLSSVVVFLYQRDRERRQEEERRQQGEKKAAEDTLGQFRQALRDGRLRDAEQLWAHLEPEKVQRYLNAEDMAIAQRLLALARGDLAAAGEDPPPAGWLEETAAVLAYLAEHMPADRCALEARLRLLPLDKLSSPWRDRLEGIKAILQSRAPVQGRDWPPYPSPHDLPALPIVFFGETRNPFAGEKAEESENWLFGQEGGLFWSEHPLYRRLVVSKGATLVYGEEGSGKTALALALGKYRPVFQDRETFSCYLRGTPTIEEIRSALAQRLFSFLERLPSFLILLNDEQRRLLARLLIVELGQENVLGWLGYTAQSERWTWLNNAASETQKRFWQAETSIHLRLLREAVLTSHPCAFSESQWLLALMTCLRSLDFRRAVYIIIDAGETFAWDWYTEIILRRQNAWRELHLHTIVLTSAVEAKAEPASVRFRPSTWHELTWEDSQLKKMVEWRWEAVARKSFQDFLNCFSASAWQTLLHAAGRKPARLLSLLNNLISRKEPPFRKQDIQRLME